MRKERWKLKLPLEEARRNEEVIAVADSQILRWIDELNGIVDADATAREIKARIKGLRKRSNGAHDKREIRKLYAELDQIQFKPDYLCLIIDKEKDYYSACRGFTVNDIKYVRLLGTNGGIKNSTIVFVSERLAPELRRRIENGRDQSKELVTAKLEAYKALVCSASNPVSMPHGVAVVNDAETQFLSDIIYLNDDVDGEPLMEFRKDEPITMNASDGYGLILPSLAERWSEELDLGYVMSGCNTRNSFEKGMVVTFDFVDFAERVADNYIIQDAWGDEVDIRQVEMVLTTSMVKLWDSYESCDSYLQCCEENYYTFGVSKVTPETLENERNTNYQFLQSYPLDDDDIEELISPTINEIKDVLQGDWRKTVLFLKGTGMTEKSVDKLDDDFIKALMIDRRVLDDSFVQNAIYQLIRKRIDDAKVGVIKVHGNYSIVCGDPYLLCQSIFGLPKTGLLQAGQIYNQYWADAGADKLACFRAPMTCHNNIRLVEPVDTDDVRYWYQHLKTVTVFNSWDTATAALNGCDFDGDLVMLTDNRVLVDKLTPLPALVCAQRKAQKRISTEEDFVRSNIDSFGNDIGQTTNWITSMFEVQSRFPYGSREYEELLYRIMCGEIYQQNAIDKAKGIVCKPMPRYWHDRHTVNAIDDEDLKVYLRSILADKKPYFMRYIYPDLMRQYNDYIRATNRNALREFQMTVPEIIAIPENKRTERQQEFLKYYYRRLPVGIGDCVMNKICRRFEEEFDGHVAKHRSRTSFDHRFMKSRSRYSDRQFYAIERLYKDYNRRVRNYSVFADFERVDEDDAAASLAALNEEFQRECELVCRSRNTLCNIILDLCYTRSATKRFAWNVCGSDIIRNLLASHGNVISFPTYDPNGEIVYGGDRFTIKTKEVGI